MKAIRTRYVGPSNVRGSRYIATDSDNNRVILSADYSLNSDENHRAAAYALRDKMQWKGEMQAGEFQHAYYWIFVS